jgi:predicted  nucleic acid-binding Zn-ribbon protein
MTQRHFTWTCSVVITYTEEYTHFRGVKKKGVGHMSDEIRPIEGFSPMRPMSPYYGGADLTVPGQGQGIKPVQGIPSSAQGQELAYATEPVFTTAPSPEAPALSPEQRLPHIMKMLDDPAYHKEFCQQFGDYLNEMNPNQSLMPPGTEGAMKMPMGGGGLPMIPGLGGQQGLQDKDSKDRWNESALSDALKKNGLDDGFNLSGSVEDQISQLNNALSQLESRKSELESLIQKLEAEIAQLESQLQELETEKRNIESQKQQKSQEMNQAKQEQQKLQNQKAQLKSEESQLQGQKQSLTTQIQTLGTQITQMTAQIAGLRASAATMHAEAAVLLANPFTAAAGAAMEAQAMALEAQITALEAQKAALQAQKQQAECQLQQVEAQLQQNQSRQAQVDQQLQVVDNKIQKLQSEIAELDQKLQQIDQKIADAKQQITDKKKELADRKSELAQVKLNIARGKQKQQELSAQEKNKNQEQAPGGFGNPLSMLGGMGGGKPPGMEAKDELEQKAKDVASPGGIIDMNAQKPNPDQKITQLGQSPDQEQVGQVLEEVAAKYGVPPDVMKAMAWNDSKFDTNKQSADGEARGAIQVASDLNPDYDVARGNRNPSYNLEYGGSKLKSLFERSGDWKIATSQFYGRDNAGAAMGAQVMAMAASRPWDTTGNQANPTTTASRGNQPRRG